MIKRFAVAAVAAIGICSAIAGQRRTDWCWRRCRPGRRGRDHRSGRSDYDRDRVRERTIIREREPRRDETVIIKKRDRDYDRDYDRKVIIDR